MNPLMRLVILQHPEVSFHPACLPAYLPGVWAPLWHCYCTQWSVVKQPSIDKAKKDVGLLVYKDKNYTLAGVSRDHATPTSWLHP